MFELELILGLLIATAIPLIFLWLIYTRDLYAAGTMRTVLLCFAWGAVAFFLAYHLHTNLIRHADMSPLLVRSRLAPISEEIFKALILVWLVRRPKFTYFVDGAIYGFAVGIGFAILENYDYILNSYQGAALMTAIGRTLSSNLVHAASSALVGVTLGLSRFQRSASRRWLFLFGGLLAAILVHGGFNNTLDWLSAAGVDLWLSYLAAMLFGLGGAALILVLIWRGLLEERGWIEETLGSADRITQGEARAVQQLAEAGVMLAPIAERFSAEKATLVSSFLVKQARLGILRKTLEKLPDEELRQDTRTQITELYTEMDGLRRKVGAYPMLYLRSIYTEENHSVWERLEKAVVDDAAAPAAGAATRTVPVVGASTAEPGASAGFADLMESLPAMQRDIVRTMLRKRRRLSYASLYQELAARSPALGTTHVPDAEVRQALDDLINAKKLMRIEAETDIYVLDLKRKEGAQLSQGIWARLESLSAASPSSGIDTWQSLKASLEQQAAAHPASQGPNLWETLARRIPA